MEIWDGYGGESHLHEYAVFKSSSTGNRNVGIRYCRGRTHLEGKSSIKKLFSKIKSSA